MKKTSSILLEKILLNNLNKLLADNNDAEDIVHNLTVIDNTQLSLENQQTDTQSFMVESGINHNKSDTGGMKFQMYAYITKNNRFALTDAGYTQKQMLAFAQTANFSTNHAEILDCFKQAEELTNDSLFIINRFPDFKDETSAITSKDDIPLIQDENETVSLSLEFDKASELVHKFKALANEMYTAYYIMVTTNTSEK